MKHRTLTYISFCIIWLLGLITLSCDRQPDARLLRAESMITDSLPQARALLDSIDRSSLSEADRNLRDLLAIKAADKAYVKHTADSAILRVVDYYDRHQSTVRYPEALYYAGRVYSDLGDYPTALKYFQDALDEFAKNDNSENLKLKGNILSQIGRLMNTLRIYDEAAEYIQKVIEINRLENDSINLIYNLELLGAVKLHEKKFEEADSLLRQSMSLAKGQSMSLQARQATYLAAVKLEKGEIDSALTLIKNAPEQITDSYKNTAAAYAAIIYLQANKPDSAYLYARQLIGSNSINNVKTGYSVIFSPEISRIIPQDSLAGYSVDYAMSVEEFLNRNAESMVQVQIARYNYSMHDRERDKTEIKNRTLAFWLTVSLCLLLVLFSTVFYLRYRNNKHILQLRNAIDTIAYLRLQISGNKDAGIMTPGGAQSEPSSDKSGMTLYFQAKDKKTLRERLIEEIRAACDSLQDSFIPQSVHESDIFKSFRERVVQKECIAHDDSMWESLAGLVRQTWPEFENRIHILCNGKVGVQQWHLVLLIKLRTTPSEMMTVFGREKGDISGRRRYLSKKILGFPTSTDYIDKFIRLL